MPAEDKDVPVGTEVGGYIIERELGRGGMGVVYAATHPMIGKRCAIKVLRRAMSDNPVTAERFLHEARSVNQIGHPGIVDIFAFGSLVDGRYYLAMDLLDGESLRQRIKRAGALHVAEMVHVIDEVASALIAAHGKGFIHRDLKPDNIFLSVLPGRIDVKLLDFGLAKLMPEAGARAFRTATGVQLGTPDYSSPEQLRSATEVDEKTDVYALGVTAYEMLLGERPRRLTDGTFELAGGRTIAEVLGRVPLLAPALAKLVEAMVSRDRDDRPSLASVRVTLKQSRAGLPSLSAIALPSLMATQDLADLTESQLGARPLLPTPPSAMETVKRAPRSQVVTAQLRAQQPPESLASPADARAFPAASGPPDPIATTSRGYASGPAPAQASGLAVGKVSTGTRLGVPPPPASVPPRRTPDETTAQGPARRNESRTWLVVSALLVAIAGIALAVVLA